MKPIHRFASRLALAAVLLSMALPVLAAPAAEGNAEGKKGPNVVNVNSADAGQLALLPRVGPSVAQRILDYRKKNGPFKSAEDLMLVQGIGEKTFQLLKPYVATSGETTLHEKVKAGSKAGKSPKAAAKESSR
jgi:competence ComEA-like helix-hairpin-helix protein